MIPVCFPQHLQIHSKLLRLRIKGAPRRTFVNLGTRFVRQPKLFPESRGARSHVLVKFRICVAPTDLAFPFLQSRPPGRRVFFFFLLFFFFFFSFFSIASPLRAFFSSPPSR